MTTETQRVSGPRSRGRLHYKLGLLLEEYDAIKDDGELPDGFVIYETFTDRQIDEKPYLRRLSKHRGRIDALQYILPSESVPRDFDWLPDRSPDSTEKARDSVKETYSALCTERGGVGNTKTSYLAGWLETLNYVSGQTDRFRLVGPD